MNGLSHAGSHVFRPGSWWRVSALCPASGRSSSLLSSTVGFPPHRWCLRLCSCVLVPAQSALLSVVILRDFTTQREAEVDKNLHASDPEAVSSSLCTWMGQAELWPHGGRGREG